MKGRILVGKLDYSIDVSVFMNDEVTGTVLLCFLKEGLESRMSVASLRGVE
jgi:hypothetical protein